MNCRHVIWPICRSGKQRGVRIAVVKIRRNSQPPFPVPWKLISGTLSGSITRFRGKTNNWLALFYESEQHNLNVAQAFSWSLDGSGLQPNMPGWTARICGRLRVINHFFRWGRISSRVYTAQVLWSWFFWRARNGSGAMGLRTMPVHPGAHFLPPLYRQRGRMVLRQTKAFLKLCLFYNFQPRYHTFTARLPRSN